MPTKMLTLNLENIQNCIFRYLKTTKNSQFYIRGPMFSEEKGPFDAVLGNIANETILIH